MNEQDTTGELSPQEQSKRRFMARMSALVGGTAAAQLLGGNAIPTALAYTPQADSADKAGKIFSQPDMAMLREICDLVIPRTDTPGAVDVDTHGFIDNQLYHCYKSEDQAQAKSILAKINQVSRSRFNKDFVSASVEQRLAVLIDLEKPVNEFDQDDRIHFKFIKQQVLFGYYTSEVGASQELEYLAIPGGYKGSIPYDSVGKAWGSLSYYY